MIDTKALREKILDLAIRGKLVPQDPNDEPASVLLERIRAQKQQMVKEGKLKAKDIKNDTIIFKGEDNLHYEQFQDGSVKCIEDEIPFEVPEGWVWERLGNISLIARGGSPRPIKSYLTNDENGINWIKIGDTEKDGKYIYSTKEKIKPEGVLKSRYVKSGDFLLTNSMSFGRPYILKTDGCIHDGWLVIGNIELVFNQDYLYYALSANFMYKVLAVLAGGSTVDNLNSDLVKALLFPIPPMNEQIHIASKVENLLYLLKKIDENEEIITKDKKNIKSKILDLAIRGKLVPQDPNDEPASVLLERIKAEKEELIKQGKIKRDKKESVIFKGEDNSYYQDLPENWEICSIMAIAEVDLGKTLDKNKNTGKFYPYLRSVNIKWNEIDLSDIKGMQFEEDELQRYSIVKGDLLICEGGDVGRCCIWSSDETIYYQNALHRVRFHGGCEPKYFLYFMMYLEHTGYLKRISNGVTIKHLTKTVLTTIPFMLPPLAEQKRIVDEIEKIFAVLDDIAKQVA